MSTIIGLRGVLYAERGAEDVCLDVNDARYLERQA